MFYMHYLSSFLPFCPSCWLSLTLIFLPLFAFIFESFSPLLHHITFYIFSLSSSSLLFPLLSFPLHIPPLLVPSLISPLCFTSVLLACPFLSPAICLSNMAVPSQLGAFPGNKTSNTVPPQLNGPQFCFCHSRYMQRDKTEKNERDREAQKPVWIPPKKTSLDD